MYYENKVNLDKVIVYQKKGKEGNMANNNQEKIETVEIYTDGACSNNPGPGGFGTILMYQDIKKEISGYKENTTNNIMEMTAVIEGLNMLKRKCQCRIYSDSAYVVNAFKQNWIDNWEKNNWKTANKKEVKNKELWIELKELVKKHNAEFIKVKGHSDNEYNNRCDELARQAIVEKGGINQN